MSDSNVEELEKHLERLSENIRQLGIIAADFQPNRKRESNLKFSQFFLNIKIYRYGKHTKYLFTFKAVTIMITYSSKELIF